MHHMMLLDPRFHHVPHPMQAVVLPKRVPSVHQCCSCDTDARARLPCWNEAQRCGISGRPSTAGGDLGRSCGEDPSAHHAACDSLRSHHGPDVHAFHMVTTCSPSSHQPAVWYNLQPCCKLACKWCLPQVSLSWLAPEEGRLLLLCILSVLGAVPLVVARLGDPSRPLLFIDGLIAVLNYGIIILVTQSLTRLQGSLITVWQTVRACSSGCRLCTSVACWAHTYAASATCGHHVPHGAAACTAAACSSRHMAPAPPPSPVCPCCRPSSTS